MRFLAIATTLFCTTLGAIAPSEIVDYWFRPHESRAEQSQRWFNPSSEIDEEIRSHFGPLVEAAANGELIEWTETPEGRLALIIVLDQFPRQIYRNTPEAYSCDPMAQQVALEGLSYGDDLKLPPLQRVFYYMPLQHAENLELQALSVAKFTNLTHAFDAYDKSVFESYLDYAERHHAVIVRFGRFPHRNAALDRPSTPNEESFLDPSDSPF